MSTKISAIIDGLASALATLFPNAVEHVNPYAIELNDAFALRDGQSFFLGPSSNTNEMSAGIMSIEREIVVNRTLEVSAAKEDISIRRTREKELMESQYDLVAAFEDDPVLDPLLEVVTFVGDNGIELIQGDEAAFLAIRSTFTVRYYEQL
jgi:hypothetical protein